MNSRLVLLGLFAGAALGQAQVKLVAGWDFGQFVFAGWSSTDPTFNADGTGIPANHSESAGISPVFTHEDGLPYTAGTGTIHWDGSFGSSVFDGSFTAGADVQAAPGTRVTNATVPGTDVLGAATYARTLSNIDSDPADQAMLIAGTSGKSFALRVNLVGFQDFSPSAQGNFANLSIAASSDSGATIEWSYSGSVIATTVVAGNALSNFSSYSVDLPAEVYGGERTLLARVSGGNLIIDNLQINGLPAAVIEPAAIATPPADQETAPGGTVTFTVATSGPAPVSYQWQFEGENLTDGPGVSGSDTATLTLTGVDEADLGAYRVVVTFPEEVILTSAAASLVFEFAPVFSAQPAASTEAQTGSSVTLTATVNGAPAPTLRWRKGDIELEDGPGISGSTTASLTLSDLELADSGTYVLRATNAVDFTDSSAAVLTVFRPLSITTPPAARLAIVGASAVFTVTAEGTGTLFYQWFKGESALDGQTSATLTLPAVTPADVGSYSVRITDDRGSIRSAAAPLTVGIAVPVNTKLTQTFVPGQGMLLTADMDAPAGGRYQWLRSGKVIVGATSKTYFISGGMIADSGTYTVQIFDAAGKKVATRTIAKVAISPASTYDALVRDEESGEAIGRVQVVVSSKGGFTGQLRHEDGKTYSFKGDFVFGANGSANAFTGTIKRSKPLVAFTYELGLDALNQTLTFALRENTMVLGTASGDLRLGTGVVTAWAGTYSLALTPLSTELPNQPTAVSTLKAVVSVKGGSLKITGKLADGTTVSGSFASSTTADYATWFALYSSKGRLAGGLSLSELTAGVYGADIESSGEFVWFRPANAKSKVFPGGIDLLLSPVLARP